MAEFTVGMILTVIRRLTIAFVKTTSSSFLTNLSGKTIGIIGTGKIGLLTSIILSKGFGCTVITYDPYPSDAAEEHGIVYVNALLARSTLSACIAL